MGRRKVGKKKTSKQSLAGPGPVKVHWKGKGGKDVAQKSKGPVVGVAGNSKK